MKPLNKNNSRSIEIIIISITIPLLMVLSFHTGRLSQEAITLEPEVITISEPVREASFEVNRQADTHGGLAIASWYDYDLPDYPDYSKAHSTCASRDYPKGTVLNVWHGMDMVSCYVNDYGPEESTRRDIDLSSHAFDELAPLSVGLLEVEIAPIKIITN